MKHMRTLCLLCPFVFVVTSACYYFQVCHFNLIKERVMHPCAT
uniref:Uncharacterized protein n=1 Tax=Arundo donax TaxID=35708 RepID=A0A0A9F7D3_ARUDO